MTATWNPLTDDDGILATRVVVHDVALTDDEVRLVQAAQHRAGYDDLRDTCSDEIVAVALLLDRLATTLDQPNGGAAA